MKFVALAFLILTLGCGSILPEPYEEPTVTVSSERAACMERCYQLQDYYMTMKTIGIVGGAVGAATTTSGALVEGLVDDEDAHVCSLSLLIIGGVGSIMAVVGNWGAGEYATQATECVARCEGL